MSRLPSNPYSDARSRPIHTPDGRVNSSTVLEHVMGRCLFVMGIGVAVALLSGACTKDSVDKTSKDNRTDSTERKNSADKDTPGAPHLAPTQSDNAPTTATGPTLKMIMARLGMNMAAIGSGLWLENYSLIAEHANAIADHPHASATELKRIKAALGANISQFKAADQKVHETAVRLKEAARQAKMADVLKELSTLQSGCVSCHSAFRVKLLTR